jgi:hypothetical protein
MKPVTEFADRKYFIKEKTMKKKSLLTAGLILAAVLILTGCTSLISKENEGYFDNIRVPAHDFTSMGLVFSETMVENGKGELFTYNALLKEAHKLGADAIVNVSIDVIRQGTKFLNMYLNPKETWYGSALAIKYTTAIKDVTTTTNEGETIISEGVIMNRGLWNISSTVSGDPVQQEKKKLFGIIPLPF